MKLKTQAEKDWEELYGKRLKGRVVLRIIYGLAPLYIVAFFAELVDEYISDLYTHPLLVTKLIGPFFIVFWIMVLYAIIAGIYTSIKTGHTPKRSGGTGADGT